MKKTYLWMVSLLLLVALLAGCSAPNKKTQSEPSKDDAPAIQSQENTDTLLWAFLDRTPDAVIHDVIREDMDRDGTEDLVILYTSEEKGVYTGVSVSFHSAVDLSGGQGWKFSSKATVTWKEDVPIISVCLTDPADGTLYQYDVAYTYDSANKEVNYEISSVKVN